MLPSSKFYSINHLVTILGSQFEVVRYFNLLYDPYFQQLLNNDLLNITNWGEADHFFSEHAGFIQGFHKTNNVILGTKAWITLLDVIQSIDNMRFKEIHKGTPYYFSAIFYLKMEKYEDGLEFMDFGLSQDFRIHNRKEVTKAPGWLYLTLYPTGGNDEGQAQILNESLLNFIHLLSKFNILTSIEELRNIITTKILLKSERARRSAWASLISQILEFNQNKQILRIAPLDLENQIKAHLSLVKMSLILETLLKKSAKSKKINSKKPHKNKAFKVYSHPNLALGGLYKCLSIGTKSILPQSKDFNYKILEKSLLKVTLNDVTLGYSIAILIRNNVNHTFQNSSINESLYEKLFITIFNVQIESLRKFY
ncbi:hypothetical protein HY025_04800 [Candidatus Daviesbacteria bacterium]|nr:hypothetical protein [Candidatus Daviesbacteria bacterium]